MPTEPMLELDTCAVASVDGDRVEAATARLVSLADASRIAELFKLLGDPTRLRILYALLEAGELCVCDLSVVVGVPETSASHALRLLRMAGLVRSRRDGRMAYYAIDDHHVRLVLDLAAEHLRHGAAR